MGCIEDVLKILDICFSYNKKLEQEENFLNHIVKIQNTLKLWKLRNLTIEGRIVIFKSLAISKLFHLALVTEIPSTTINLLTKIQMESKIVIYVMTMNMVVLKMLISFRKL